MKKYKKFMNVFLVLGIILSYLVISKIFVNNPDDAYHNYSFYGYKNFTNGEEQYESQESMEEYSKFWGIPGL